MIYINDAVHICKVTWALVFSLSLFLLATKPIASPNCPKDKKLHCVKRELYNGGTVIECECIKSIKEKKNS